jgi:hypothetical protein
MQTNLIRDMHVLKAARQNSMLSQTDSSAFNIFLTHDWEKKLATGE